MVTGTFARQVGFVIGALGVILLAWRLSDVLVLAFGATVLATDCLRVRRGSSACSDYRQEPPWS